MARLIGVGSTTLNQWTLGRKLPDAESADKVADALGVDRDFVLAMVGIRPVEDDDAPEVQEFVATIRRVDWSVPGRVEVMRGILDSMISFDRERRK